MSLILYARRLVAKKPQEKGKVKKIKTKNPKPDIVSRVPNDKLSKIQLKPTDGRKIGRAMGIQFASLEILRHVSWIPNPILKAFLLNSERDDAEDNDMDVAISSSV